MEWLQDPVVMLFLPLALVFVLSMRRRQKLPLPLPPGPRPLPVIGNMLMMDQLTHRGLAKLAERYGGLLHLRLGFLHAVAVSTPDVAREVLQAQDSAFANRPATIAIAYLTYDRADMAFAHYGPFWRQMRKLCVVKLFSRKRAESWASVRDEVDSLMRFVASSSGTTVNLGEVIFNLTKNITFRAAFGTQSHENQDEFISILQEFSKLFGAFNVGDFIPWLGWMDLQGINKRLTAAREALDRFIDKIIDEHLKSPKEADADDADMVDDMLAFLADAPSAGKSDGQAGGDLQGSLRLTRDNIKAIIMDVMFGGTETVASAIEWAMAELMKSPDDMRRVQQELADVVGLDRKSSMEWLYDPPVLFFAFLAVIFVLSVRRRRKLPLPPGPRALPIIGNMLMMDQLTHRGLAKLAERYGGLLHLRLGFLHAVAVSTPDVAREVLQAQDSAFSNRPATIAITRRRAESWASVRDEVDSLIRFVARSSGTAVNLGEVIFNLTKNITFRAAFGTQSHENQDEFISILQEFSKLFGAFNVGDFIPWLSWMDLQGINKRLAAARGALDRFVDKIIDEHMAKNAKGADDADDADMVDEMLAFLGGGGGSADGEQGGDHQGDELQSSLRLTRDNIKAIIM
uniref:Cytochrome P450 84A1 n=1 Tax=Ananas comosus var. bracteatus TaxID=296719 RepID=A0A6V7PZH9_ANACO|nr:unnamed protein product [Ananas comosus var. bracteatus]